MLSIKHICLFMRATNIEEKGKANFYALSHIARNIVTYAQC